MVCCFCSRLESLQKKRCKLHKNRNSGIRFIKLLDSLLSIESDSDLPAELRDKRKAVIRNSGALNRSPSSVPSPAVSELRSDDGVGELTGVLPLPVQNLNLEITDSVNALSDDVPTLQCVDGSVSASAVPDCVALSFTDATSAASVTSPVAAVCTEMSSLAASQHHVPMSVKMPGPKLPTASSASLVLRCTQQPSASQPANGLVISVTAGNPVIKTSTTQIPRFAAQTVATSARSVTIAPNTSVSGSNSQSSGKTTSVRIHGGQLVHLTIPTMLSLTGTNLQIRQLVSFPPCAVSCQSVPVCSETGLPTVPCPMINIVSSQPSATCTMTTKNSSLLPHSVAQPSISFQQFQTPSELRSTPAGCTLDRLSTQSMFAESVCHGSVAEVPAGCSTPPVNHDEDARLDATNCEIGTSGLSLAHGEIIPNIPTPDPSCSSQE